MIQSPIALTGLTLATPLLDESVAFYVERFGLHEVERSSDHVALASVAAPRPPVLLFREREARLIGLSFAVRDAGHLAAAHRELSVSHAPNAVRDDMFAVNDPDGTVITLHVGVDASRLDVAEPTDRPLFMSHVVINSRDPDRLIAFYRDALGLRISDRYERGLLTFMRCDQPQHHCVAISPGTSDGLNHFAMDCGNIDAVMRAISRMHAEGSQEVWGPGRHGPGGNVFCYFEDPTGFVPEFTCDVLQIEEDADWEPHEWKRTPENGNVWLSGGPTPRAAELMSGTAFPNGGAQLALSTTE